MPVTEDKPIMEGVATPPKADTPQLEGGDVKDLDASKPELAADNDMKAEGGITAGEEGTTEPKSENDEYTDILGNGTLLKKVIQKGTGPRAQMREKVTITLLASIPVMGIKLPEQRVTFVIGEADVVQALDMAVALMDVGEVAEILAGFDYMYGQIGLKKKKERGNYFFKRQEFEHAIHVYTLALKIVDPSATKMCDVSADQLQQVLEFRSVVHCNLSASLFKLSAFEGARQSAEESVKIQPSHAKAYIRLGQAEEKLGNPEEAIRAYKKALSFDATNRWLHNECARLSKVKQKTKEDQQKMYSKMFWGSNPPPVNEEQKETPEPSSLSSFWTRGGLGLVGAGLVSLVGIGMYRYLNH